MNKYLLIHYTCGHAYWLKDLFHFNIAYSILSWSKTETILGCLEFYIAIKLISHVPTTLMWSSLNIVNQLLKLCLVF